MELIELNPEKHKDLPAGRTFECSECGTRLRIGQPHTALQPKPHVTLDALTVLEPMPNDYGHSAMRSQLFGVGGGARVLAPIVKIEKDANDVWQVVK